MSSPDRDPFEDRLRDVLRSDVQRSRDTDTFLEDVRRGARSRRRRHVAGSAAATLLVVGGGFAVVSSDVFDSSRQPIASPPSTSVSAQSGTDPSDATADATATPPSPAAPTDVLSLTATGAEQQWALRAKPGTSCRGAECAVVLQKAGNDGSWREVGSVGTPTTTDPTQRYAVSQIRFAGDEAFGYDGWAFGGALFSSHAGEAGSSWRPVFVPASGAVTELEAHGSAVYALLEDDNQTSRLLSSPVESDDFQVVDTNITLGATSELSVTDDVVAFLNDAEGMSQVVSLDGEGQWAADNPCPTGEPRQLSAATTALWALCTSGSKSTVLVRPQPGGQWKQAGTTYSSDAILAARSPDSALVAEPSGASSVTVGGSERLTTDDFSNATMLGFNNPDVGFAIVDGRAFRTDDGGRTWASEDVLR